MRGSRDSSRTVAIKCAKRDDLIDGDLDHVIKVVGYIKRHRTKEPSGNVGETDWRCSLMNWGHDPCEDDRADC